MLILCAAIMLLSTFIVGCYSTVTEKGGKLDAIDEVALFVSSWSWLFALLESVFLVIR